MQKYTKTRAEIKLMEISGQIAAFALKKVLKNIKPGVKCSELDKIAEEEIKKRGATSSFKTVGDYKYTICTTINDQVVHGIPGERILKEGDIIGIDIGALYNKYHSDMAITVPVGNISRKSAKFLQIGKNTLSKAIKEAKIGNMIGDISDTIQTKIEENGFSIVKSLTGHGVGRNLHEEPMVPGFGEKRTGISLTENMTLGISIPNIRVIVVD